MASAVEIVSENIQEAKSSTKETAILTGSIEVKNATSYPYLYVLLQDLDNNVIARSSIISAGSTKTITLNHVRVSRQAYSGKQLVVALKSTLTEHLYQDSYTPITFRVRPASEVKGSGMAVSINGSTKTCQGFIITAQGVAKQVINAKKY